MAKKKQKTLSLDYAQARIAVFSALRVLPEAKALRGVALHYARCRNKFGTEHPVTQEAEESLYRQMFTCYPEARRALSVLAAKED